MSSVHAKIDGRCQTKRSLPPLVHGKASPVDGKPSRLPTPTSLATIEFDDDDDDCSTSSVASSLSELPQAPSPGWGSPPQMNDKPESASRRPASGSPMKPDSGNRQPISESSLESGAFRGQISDSCQVGDSCFRRQVSESCQVANASFRRQVSESCEELDTGFRRLISSQMSDGGSLRQISEARALPDTGFRRQISESVQVVDTGLRRQISAPSSKPDAGFRRQISAPIQVSVADVCSKKIQSEVPKAIISHILREKAGATEAAAPTSGVIAVSGPGDFRKAFQEDSPSFILVDSREESCALAFKMLRSQEANIAVAVILVLLEPEKSLGQPLSDKVPDFITNGADDVLVAPAQLAQSSQMGVLISVSVAKARTSRQHRVNLTKQLRDYRHQCHEFFWKEAHVDVPTFPQVKQHLTEINDKRVGDTDLTKKLGEGQFGSVHLWQRGKESGAVKVIAKRRLRSLDEVLQLAVEFDCLRKLQHENVVKARAIVHGMQNMYLFMEMAGTISLFQTIQSAGGGLPSARAADIFIQISTGLAYAHGVCVSHGDLKPENVVMSNDGCAKLVDFGLAVDFHECVPALDFPRGTMPFMAPELMSLKQQWDPPAADIWSVGVILLEMLCGNHSYVNLLGWKGKDLMRDTQLARRADETIAFFAADETEARGNALASVRDLCKETPSPLVIQVLGDMLQIAPEDRLAAVDIVKRVGEVVALL